MAKKKKDKKAFRDIQQELLKKQKVAKKSHDPNRDFENPAWQFNLLDWEGPWGWRIIGTDKWQDILTKLGHFETRTWADIKSHTGSHAVLIADCPNSQVIQRLTEIKLDDIDELFSLRLSGKERVWGILDEHIFKFLWWDPNHKVWPSPKKHT